MSHFLFVVVGVGFLLVAFKDWKAGRVKLNSGAIYTRADGPAVFWSWVLGGVGLGVFLLVVEVLQLAGVLRLK